MFFSASTLDDLLRKVFARLLKCNKEIYPSRSKTLGPATELTGVLLQLTNPRARLSRTEKKGTVFSGLGELLWYFSKSNDLEFISYYIPDYIDESIDGKTVYGGYGPRLFRLRRSGKCIDQVQNVRRLLKEKPQSRRAVIQLFDAADIAEPRIEIPCTCTLQFILRGGRLDLLVSMRSNDGFGRYKHFVGSPQRRCHSLGVADGHRLFQCCDLTDFSSPGCIAPTTVEFRPVEIRGIPQRYEHLQIAWASETELPAFDLLPCDRRFLSSGLAYR